MEQLINSNNMSIMKPYMKENIWIKYAPNETHIYIPVYILKNQKKDQERLFNGFGSVKSFSDFDPFSVS